MTGESHRPEDRRAAAPTLAIIGDGDGLSCAGDSCELPAAAFPVVGSSDRE